MRLTHVRLLVADFDACFRFYRDAIGFQVLWGKEGGGYADFQAGEGPR
ncbi:MAG: VOC family protein [Chloroflexi bacterium]|nr:VOC family protein [Chloroflexota bacterium]